MKTSREPSYRLLVMFVFQSRALWQNISSSFAFRTAAKPLALVIAMFFTAVYLICYPRLGISSEFRVKVVDSSGEPLANTVIVLPGLSSASINQSPAIMDQIDKTFVPMVLAVEQGRSVSFPNSDNIRHHVYSFSAPKRFEIKLYANQPQAPIEFNEAGIVVLGCNIHDTMIGYIFVSQWQSFMVSDEEGDVVFDELSKHPSEILYWHPWIKNKEIGRYQLSESDVREISSKTITHPVRCAKTDEKKAS